LRFKLAFFEEPAISAINTSQGARAASARAFVHSLNILIKYARMYGYEHKRTEAQFETTWNELKQGLPTTGDAGFLLGVSDNKLLLDGIPLETGNAERSFATLLSTAGLASLHFSKDVTQEDFIRLDEPSQLPDRKRRMSRSRSKKLWARTRRAARSRSMK